MSNKIKVISSKNNQVSSPLLFTLVMYLLHDKFPTPQWLWGIVGFLLAVWFGLYIYGLKRYEEVDIFEEIEKRAGVVCAGYGGAEQPPCADVAKSAIEELQQLREALTWKPASEGINPGYDVFEIKLGNEICNVYTALIVGEYYQIGGVDNLREGFYFGQWDLESLLEDYPNALWREIVEVPTDLPEVERI